MMMALAGVSTKPTPAGCGTVRLFQIGWTETLRPSRPRSARHLRMRNSFNAIIGPPHGEERFGRAGALLEPRTMPMRQNSCRASPTSGSAQRVSHSAMRQLSHSSGDTWQWLTNPCQHLENAEVLPGTRWSFCWHAGCWLIRVGMRAGTSALTPRCVPPRQPHRHMQACRAIRLRGGKPRGKSI